ncbi:MAG: hypothetical protein KU37_03330 [Sulfuricurvum sp. PC08-66]|nr:MAG: hypothetical protein KU37_03330 [Sulfuricurvum sp. PC08-66]
MKLHLLSKGLLTLMATAALSWGATYGVDASHSKVSFKIKHMMISNVTGHFNTFDGTFDVTDNKLSALKGTVDVASVDTDNAKRDGHLKAPDFFDVANHPTMTFVMKKRDKNYIIGDLTIRGVTKSVTFIEEFGGEIEDPWGNQRAGLTLTARIDRTAFGVSYAANSTTLANELDIILELEGIAK